LRAVFRAVDLRAVFRTVVLRAVFRAAVVRLLVFFFAFVGAMLTKPLQIAIVK